MGGIGTAENAGAKHQLFNGPLILLGPKHLYMNFNFKISAWV